MFKEKVKKFFRNIMATDTFDQKRGLQFAHSSITVYTIFVIVLICCPLIIAIAAGEVFQLNMLIPIALVTLAISLVFSTIVFLLRTHYKYLEVILSAAVILIFINAFIFPMSAGMLDGREQLIRITDSLWPLARNGAFYLLIIGLMILFRKQLRFLIIPIALFSVFSVITNANTMFNMSNNINSELNKEAFESVTAFSTEQNIVVIVLDMTQGSLVERTFMENPHFYETFNGFTMFTRAFSSFPFTRFNNNAIQSGVFYPSDDLLWEDQNPHSLPNSFMSDMQEVGFRVNLLGRLFETTTNGEFPYVGRVSPEVELTLYNTVATASVARLTGYWMRVPFLGFLSRFITENEVVESGAWLDTEFALVVDDTKESIAITEALIDNLRLGNDEKKLMYFWNYGTHTPVLVSRDGEINTDVNTFSWHGISEELYINEMYFFFNQLERLFNVMHELDVYDNSLIILVADHGTFFSPEMWVEHVHYIHNFELMQRNFGNFWPTQTYNPILMVKPPYADGSAIVSYNPAWNGDVRNIINYYYENWTNTSAIDVLAKIRAENYEVPILFGEYNIPFTVFGESIELHEILYITELSDIPDVFYAHSGVWG
ncbi:MAG: hypothetical protein LBC73_10990 [Oscillospiraceae bacterium]|nr:hypothetical protein [Oscillospiraceae bacterium]